MRAYILYQVCAMKLSTMLCLGLIAAGSVPPALADPFERGVGFRPSVQDQRPQPGRQGEAQMPMPQREQRGPGEVERGRMNPDERRQLRRDIQDAGKDIYQRDRQMPRRERRR